MRFHLELRASLLTVLTTVACVAIAQTGSKSETAPAAQPAPQDQEIRPPFSLMWHEPSERVEAKVEAAKLVIDERRKVNNRWVVVVDDDIDPSNINDVLWAMCTRVDARE
ncbi:MAG: hypothetical protein ABMA01_01130, partial [Chthoniobacteraceae bacterium]